MNKYKIIIEFDEDAGRKKYLWQVQMLVEDKKTGEKGWVSPRYYHSGVDIYAWPRQYSKGYSKTYYDAQLSARQFLAILQAFDAKEERKNKTGIIYEEKI